MAPKIENINGKQMLLLLLISLFGFLIFSGLTSIMLDTAGLIITHGILEIAGIIIGFIIFYITWYGASASNGIRVTVISLVILSSVILALVHMLSFPGLPTDPLGKDHIWVTSWFFSQLIWSFGMLYAATLPVTNNVPTLLSNKSLLYCTLVAVAALVANIVFSYNLLPLLNINSYDHPLAVFAPDAALAVDLITLIILYRYYPNHVGKIPQLALLFGVFSDLSFSLAFHTPFSLNIAGHFFKFLANFYVLRSLYIRVIQQPYDEVLKLKEEMEDLADNNAKLYQESEHQRNLVEDILAKIGVIISSRLDVKETLDAISDMVADMMNARQSAIALFSQDRTILRVAATYGINAPPDTIPLNNSLAGQVCETNAVLYIDDLTLHPELFRPQLIFTNIRSIICAPLINDQEIIGVVEAYSNCKGVFSKRDALLLKALGYHAGAAIAGALLYERTKMRLDEEQFLYQIAQSSAATIDKDTIMEQCTTHATKALAADVGIGFLVTDASKTTLAFKTAVGLSCKPSSFQLSVCTKLAELVDSATPTVIPAEKLPALKDICSDFSSGSIMVIPLPVDHRLLGLILLGWRRFTSTERLNRTTFAALMAQQIAMGLEKAHLYNQVKAMALSDGLTGLANRRNFDMFLNTELRRATTLKRPLSLIMLDLDKFKTYNDTYGHPTGDKLLAELGNILQRNVRSIDFPARYGGEEFSIILPECTNTDALALAEKIRQAVEAGQFPDNAGTFTARITASFGVATYDPSYGCPPPDIPRFIAAADEALYQAKGQGRNKVVNATVM